MLILLCFHIPCLVHANPSSTFTQDATEQFQIVQQELGKFRDENYHRLRMYEEKKPSQSLSPQERKKKKEYRFLLEKYYFWNLAADLKKDLIKTFEETKSSLPNPPPNGGGDAPKAPTQNEESLEFECNHLAIILIGEIQKLQKEYKINTFPTIHNVLIAIKIKKRGACKHWAEDLLTKLEKEPRTFFDIYWGQAHAATVREHNVAVLVPRGQVFKKGLVIDPWRTAGKPFWIPVSEDHYPWESWEGYLPR